MKSYGEQGLRRPVESDEEPYYCAPTYLPSDIIYPGSDTEETPAVTQAKRQRYEDAAKRCAAGERPRLLSASLRGPFDAQSGWVNPWRRPPRKPRDGDWWQPGSENMLFTRENVMQRAIAHGLGYMTPIEALAWCKASAELELDSHIGSGSLDSLENSIEQESSDEVDSTDHGDEEQISDHNSEDEDDDHAQQLPTTKNNTSVPHISQDSGLQGFKRPANVKWLKGSYISKRARWDGPALSSPTPAVLNLNRVRRRRSIPAAESTSSTTYKSPPVSGFEDIPSLNHSSRTQSGRPGSALKQLGHRMPARKRDSIAPEQLSSADIPHRQIDDIDGHTQEWRDATSRSFTSEQSRTRLVFSQENFEDQSALDLESGEPVTSPYDLQYTKNVIADDHQPFEYSSTNSFNRFPPLPRADSQQQDTPFDEADSFVTEVAPSSRGLEKFMFKKKRKISVVTSAPASNGLHSHRAPRGKGIHPQTHHGRSSPPASLLANSPRPPTREISSPLRRKGVFECQVNNSGSESVLNNLATTSWQLQGDINDKIPSDTIRHRQPASGTSSEELQALEQAEGNPSPLLQRINFLIQSSQIMESKPRQSFKKLPSKSSFDFGVGQAMVDPRLKKLPSSTQISHSARRGTNEPQAKISSKQIAPVSQVSEIINKSQNSPDTSTQSYNTTPTCSRKTPLKSRSSARRSPEIERLRRFSFESSSGGLLFSSIGGGYSRAPETIVSNTTNFEDTTVPSNHESARLETEIGDYQTYMSGDILRDVPDRIVDLGITSNGLVDEAGEKTETYRDLNQNHTTISQECTTSHPPVSIQNPDHPPSEDHPQVEQLSDRDIAVAFHVQHTVEVPDLDLQGQNSAMVTGNIFSSHTEEPDVNSEVCKSVGETTASFDQGSIAKKTNQIEDEALHPTAMSSASPDDTIDEDEMPRQAIQALQSPFAQELFIDDRQSPTSVTSQNASTYGADSEISWEGCKSQSPWAFESSDHLFAPTTLNQVGHVPLQDSSRDHEHTSAMALKDDVPEHRILGADDNEFPLVSSWSPEDENYGIRPFRHLMSPFPAPVRRSSQLSECPTNTQQLVDAALQNPWTNSFEKPASPRSQKRVAFDHVSSKNNVISEASQHLKGNHDSSPSPDDDVFNEIIFGAGFAQAAPFSNHFKMPRKFSRILPDNIQSPLKSSPSLGAQAEAFIVADRDGFSDPLQQPCGLESPTRYLQARSDSEENSHKRAMQDERVESMFTSPRTSQKDRQCFATSMSNFDMEEALVSMGDFLEDWSVEAEVKKAKEPSSGREREESGVRRQRRFGLI